MFKKLVIVGIIRDEFFINIFKVINWLLFLSFLGEILNINFFEVIKIKGVENIWKIYSIIMIFELFVKVNSRNWIVIIIVFNFNKFKLLYFFNK